MLIEIINSENVDLNDASIECCIQNLLCSHREGKHILISNESFLKIMGSHKSLGIRNCNTAQNILQNLKEYMQLKTKINYYCKVDLSSNSNEVIASNEDEKHFIVGYNFFNDSSKSQKTKLLCEDRNDYKLYKIIGEHYKHSQKMPGINISFDIVSGGGGGTKANFDHIKSMKNLCFCLLDTDKKHPKSKIGSTASKFKKADNAAFCQHFVIKSHEIESLIPLKVIEEAIQQNKLPNNYLDSHDKLKALTDFSPEIKLYFDHKLGMTVESVLDLDTRYQDKFWQDPINKAPNLSRSKCVKKMLCECEQPCLVAPGFSSNLLNAGSEVLENISHIKISNCIPPILKEEWDTIGEKLFSWGCSVSNRSRTS